MAEWMTDKGLCVGLHIEPDEKPDALDEKTVLREEADALGLQYHPNIGAEKLRGKIEKSKAAKFAEE